MSSYNDYEDMRIDGVKSEVGRLLSRTPVGYLKFMNITIELYGKMPNKFQRWMLKKMFNFEITDACG